CTRAPHEDEAADVELVDETRVEMVLGVAGARLRYTRCGLLGNPELGAEGSDELGEHRLVAQVAGDLRETGEELLDGYRARRHAHTVFEVARETDLHAVHLQARLYVPDLVGGNVDVIVVPGTLCRSRHRAILTISSGLQRVVPVHQRLPRPVRPPRGHLPVPDVRR